MPFIIAFLIFFAATDLSHSSTYCKSDWNNKRVDKETINILNWRVTLSSNRDPSSDKTCKFPWVFPSGLDKPIVIINLSKLNKVEIQNWYNVVYFPTNKGSDSFVIKINFTSRGEKVEGIVKYNVTVIDTAVE